MHPWSSTGGECTFKGPSGKAQDIPGGDNTGWGDVTGIQWTEARELLKTL